MVDFDFDFSSSSLLSFLDFEFSDLALNELFWFSILELSLSSKLFFSESGLSTTAIPVFCWIADSSRAGSFTVFVKYVDPIMSTQIINIFENHCKTVTLKRLNTSMTTGSYDLCLSIIINSFDQIQSLNSEICSLSEDIQIDLLDSSGVAGGA